MTLATEVGRLREEWGELQEKRTTGLSREELEGFRGRFPDFCRDVLGFKPTPQQLEAAAAMDKGVTQLAVIGGNGLGKDTLTAARAIYEAFVLDSLALLSGPSDRQVREVMMRREVGRLLRAALGKLRYERFTMAVHIPGREPAGILAFTSSDPDKFTGHHAPRVFIGLTESQGVLEEIWQAAQKCRVGDGLFLVVGNPNNPSGPLYAAARSSTWETLFWSAFDHPNLVEGREVIPGGPTVEWVEQMREEYGESSPFYISAVLGRFPTEAIDGLIERQWFEDAIDPARFKKLDNPLAPYRLVLDVARYGDDSSVLGIVQGGIVRDFEAWRSKSLTDTAEIVQRKRSEPRFNVGGRRPSIVVDDAGVGGGVTDTLKSWGIGVEAFNGAANPKRSRDRDKFLNARAEAYWAVREGLRLGQMALPDDEALREELLATTYFLNGTGKIQIAPKDDIKAAIGRSPDRADVVAMAAWAHRCSGNVYAVRWKV